MKSRMQQGAGSAQCRRGLVSKAFAALMSIILAVGLIPGLSVSRQAYAAQGDESGAIKPLAVTTLKTWDIGADPDHRDALTATCYYDTTTREISFVIAGEGDAQTFESPDEVPWYADTYSDGFTEIVFEEEPEITNIDYWFYGCTALYDLPYIPDSVKSMRYTFYGCPNITFIPKGFTFPEDVVTEKTFYAEEPYSPENLCSIFCSPADFDALAEAYDWESDNRELSDTMAEWDIGSPVESDVTVTLDGDGTFIVSGTGDVQEFNEMHNGYETPWLLEGLVTRIKSVVFEEDVTPTSLEGWFYGCSNLTTVPTLPDTVTNMRNTFVGCTNLTIDEGYTLPSTLLNMEQTFMGCTSLTLPEGFVFPEAVTNMFKTFYYCDALQIPDDFTFPENAVNISYVFGWSGITSVPVNFTIPDSVTNAAGVFYSCVDLTSIGDGFTIGSNVETIYDMFNYCFSLVSLPDGFTIPDSVTNISHAFERCSGLTSLPGGFAIGTNVEDMSYVFYHCSHLEALPAGFTIPDSVTDVSYAFNDCSALESLPDGFAIPDSVTDMSYIFRNCEALEALPDGFTVSDSVTDMSYAFYNCPGITELPAGFSIPEGAATSQAFFVISPYSVDDPLVTFCDASDFKALSAYDWTSDSRSLMGKISRDIFVVDTSSVIYTGEPIEPSVTSEQLMSGVDYTVEYANNIDVGTGIITITGVGNYVGTLTYEFTIDPIPTEITPDMFNVDLTNVTYIGSPIEPAVTSDLVLGEDYAVEYENNMYAGTATIIISGLKPGYVGTLTYEFTIERAFTRLAGDDRYGTMEEISNEAFESADTVVLAVGTKFPDALSAAGLAGTLDAPVLLTATDALSSEAAEEIVRLGASNVVIVGGEASISPAVAQSLTAMGLSVERVSGTDRYATALATYNAGADVWGTSGHGVKTAIIAAGTSFADTTSASSYAWWATAPIFLSGSEGLDDTTMSAIADGGFERIVIVGGVNSVPASVQIWAAGIAPTIRLAGDNRYATSITFATWAQDEGMSFNDAGIATGKNFPDALAGGALCGARGSVLLLAHMDGDTQAVDLLAAHKDEVSRVYYLGGENSITPDLTFLIETALS